MNDQHRAPLNDVQRRSLLEELRRRHAETSRAYVDAALSTHEVHERNRVVTAMSREVQAYQSELLRSAVEIVERYPDGDEVLLRCHRLAWLAHSKGQSLDDLLRCIEDVEAGERECNLDLRWDAKRGPKVGPEIVYRGRARSSGLVSVAS